MISTNFRNILFTDLSDITFEDLKLSIQERMLEIPYLFYEYRSSQEQIILDLTQYYNEADQFYL